MKKKLKLIKLETSWLSCEASEAKKHMLSFKMTTYHPYKIDLSRGQKKKLAKAIKSNCAITLRLDQDQTTGIDELMLTTNQIKRIKKAVDLDTGVELRISKTQIRKVTRQGGSLFSAVVPLARTLAPTLAKTLGLSALAGLASEGASQVAKKISGKGAMTGGFLIPQDKIQKLIDNKHLLTNKQKQEILAALQSGGQVVVKPSAKQSGGMLGTILASIGIPLALDMVKNLFGKGAAAGTLAGAPRVGRPKEKVQPLAQVLPELDAQKGKARQDWVLLLFNALLHFLETGDVGWEKKNQKEKGCCWDRKVHFKTSQFSERFCECEAERSEAGSETERSEAETKIREQTSEL